MMPIDRSAPDVKFGKYVMSKPLEEVWVILDPTRIYIDFIVLPSGSHMQV